MRPVNGIKTLVKEHDNILRMLDVVNGASLHVLGGGDVNVDDFKKMVGFIRLYADKTHHGKEEVFLFKAMGDELGSMGENLIRHGMLVEHDLGRLYVSDLDAALDSYSGYASPEALLAILVAAGSYERLLRRHILKENDVVFTFGAKKLSDEALAWLDRETQGFEADAENAALRDEQLRTLEMLENKYIKREGCGCGHVH